MGGVQILPSLSEYFITRTGLFRGFTPQPPNNAKGIGSDLSILGWSIPVALSPALSRS